MNRGQPFNLFVLALAVLLIGSDADAQVCSQLSGTFGTQQTGTTSGTSAQGGSCGGAAAPEQTFLFIAPRLGSYTFDTVGSTYDTVLYVRDNNGTQLACNDDLMPGIAQSRLSVILAQGQSVSVFVDGFEAQSGNFTLRLNPDCPLPFRSDARDLGSPLSVSITGTTSCAGNFNGGASCGGAGAGNNGGGAAADAVFLYSAPVDGNYTISTEGSNFDTVLYARVGTCSGAELGCSDDIMPGANPQSRLTLPLVNGQTILITVDGYADEAGDYVLAIAGVPATPTITATSTRTRTSTPSPTITLTSTITPSPTITLTVPASLTPTPTRTATSSRTATITSTRTATQTPSSTLTRTATRSPTTTRTNTPEATATPTSSSAPTASRTSTPTVGSPTPTPTRTRSSTPVIITPGCCQRFLPAAICEAPVSPAACAESGGTLIANASCIRGLCTSNQPTVTPTATETATLAHTSTVTSTPMPSTTPSPSPSLSPTPTTGRAVVTLPAGSGGPGTTLTVLGRVATGATGARVFWKSGSELLTLVEVPAAADGSFEAEIVVPIDAAGVGAICAAAAGIDAGGRDLACARFEVFPQQPGTLVGQVVDQDDAPLAESDVFLADTHDTPLARSTTDAEGRYSFRNLAPGDYVVHVAHDPFFFESVTRSVAAGRTASILHHDTATTATAKVYRSGVIASLAPPSFVREPIHRYWLARFASLAGGPPLIARFYVNLAFLSVAPGPISFSFLRDDEIVLSEVDPSPAPVSEDALPIADAYAVDVNVSDLPPGDLTLRISRFDIETGRDIDTIDEFHLEMIDLTGRWRSGRVGEPQIEIQGDRGRVAYHFSGRLPHPDFAFEFDQSIMLGASLAPLENHATLNANIDETYFTDDTWQGRATAEREIRLLGIDLTPPTAASFAGPSGEEFVLSDYSLESNGETHESGCPSLPAASLTQSFTLNACSAGCSINARSRPAIATCPALTTNTVAAIATDMALFAGVSAADARPRGERAALDIPLCRGFVDSEPPRSLALTVRYEPDVGACPQDCSFFEDVCIDLDAPAHNQIRCLAKVVDAEDVLLDGASEGCTAPRRKRAARVVELSANRPKAIATDGSGHALLVWVDDQQAPASLLYSYFDGAGWSSAQALTAAGFVDAPQVVFLAPDRAIAVWEQSRLSNGEAAGASLQQLLASSELYSAEWNGNGWSSPVAITNNEVADAHPSLAAFAAEQRAIVVWTRTTANPSQPTLAIDYALFNGGSWGVPARVAPDSIGLDYGASVSVDESGRAGVVFSRDLDRNLGTVTDRALVFATLSGNTWSAGDVIGPGYSPSLAFTPANEPSVAFVRPAAEAGPSTQATGEGNRSQLYFARRSQGNWTIAPVGSRVFAEMPTLRIGRDGQALIVFRRFDAASKDGLRTVAGAAAADLIQANPSWSIDELDLQSSWLPVFDLDPGAGVGVVAATQRLPLVDATTIADAVEVSVLPKNARLALKSATPSDTHPLVGDTVDIAVVIVNRGIGPVNEATPVVATVNGSSIAMFEIPAGLRLGETFASTLSYQIVQAGLQRVVFSDASGIIGEIAYGYPPAPPGLSAFLSPIAPQPQLSWEAAGRGVQRYRIFRDDPNSPGSFGELIGETAELHFTDVTAAGGRTQRYGVRSIDSAGVVSVALATVSVGSAAATCAGDCDGDGMVTIDEIVTATAIAAGERPLRDCRAFGNTGDAALAQVTDALSGALAGCP